MQLPYGHPSLPFLRRHRGLWNRKMATKTAIRLPALARSQMGLAWNPSGLCRGSLPPPPGRYPGTIAVAQGRRGPQEVARVEGQPVAEDGAGPVPHGVG